MTKPKAAPRARYTLEFKQEAVRLVEGGQSIAAAARTLGVVDQTLFNWVKAKREGKLAGADSKPVSAEQMEIARLRAELARVTMERDILGKRRRTSPRQRSEVRLHPASPARVADLGAVTGLAGQRGRVPRALRARNSGSRNSGSRNSGSSSVGWAERSEAQQISLAQPLVFTYSSRWIVCENSGVRITHPIHGRPRLPSDLSVVAERKRLQPYIRASSERSRAAAPDGIR